MRKLLENVGLLLLICVAVRIAAVLVEPALPLLVALIAVTVMAIWLVGRNGPGGGYR